MNNVLALIGVILMIVVIFLQIIKRASQSRYERMTRSSDADPVDFMVDVVLRGRLQRRINYVCEKLSLVLAGLIFAIGCYGLLMGS